MAADSVTAEAPRVETTLPTAIMPTVAGWLMLLWTAILLWQVGLAVRQGQTVRRLRRSGAPLDGGQLDFWNLELSRDLGLTRVPCLLSSAAIRTPVLIGVFRPCIVLPETLLSTCTSDELRLILAHELAHVQRCDLLWGWLPLLGRLVCGFHPLVLLAEHELGMAQEIACDEAALHLTGAASAAYGSLLVRVAARFTPRPTHGFGMLGMSESYHTLKRRLSAMKSFPSVPRHLPGGRALPPHWPRLPAARTRVIRPAIRSLRPRSPIRPLPQIAGSIHLPPFRWILRFVRPMRSAFRPARLPFRRFSLSIRPPSLPSLRRQSASWGGSSRSLRPPQAK